MRPDIPLLTSVENKRLWKEGLQRLFRANGVTQAEVASRMAKIVRRTTGETTSSSTFISALSRFVNAKNSAFPGWFEKVDARLLPLALSIGIEDDQPLWALLHQSAGKIGQDQGVWHADWPNCHVQIPIELGGKALETVAADISQYHSEMKAIHQSPWFYFIGPMGVGCRTVVRLLNAEFERPFEVLEFSDLQQALSFRRTDFGSKFVIVRHGSWINNGLDRIYQIESWGMAELKMLIAKLCPQVDSGIAASLQEYFEQCEKNPNLLGFDLRAKTLISSLSTVVRDDLSNTPEKIRLALATEQWRRACTKAPALSAFGLSRWSKLCWKMLFAFPDKSLVLHAQVQEIINALELHYGFELHNSNHALKLIEQIETGTKKNQQVNLDELRRWVKLSTSLRSVDILLQSGLFSENDQNSILLPMEIIGWACLFPEEIEDLPESITEHPHSIPILVALCARGLTWAKLSKLADPFKRSNPLLHSKLVVIYAAQQEPYTTIPLLSHLALVATALFQPSIILAHEREPLIAALQKLSKIHAELLPIIEQSEAGDFWSELPKQGPHLNWHHPRRSQLQALLPFQCPPRTTASWYKWHPRPPLSISAHQVLKWHFKNGDEVSAKLLAESHDYAVWHQLPVQMRLKAFKYTSFSNRTAAALEHLIDQLNDNQSMEISIPPRHFDLLCEAVEHLGWVNILGHLEEWYKDEIKSHGVLKFGRAKTAVLLAHHFKEKDLLIGWWGELWKHIENNLTENHPIHLALVMDFALLMKEHKVPQPFQDIWGRFEDFSQSTAQLLLHKSLAAYAHEPILKWVNSNWEPPELREALRSSPTLLELAWRHRGSRRTNVLLQWAGLLSPTPRWAINEALRDAQNYGRWPRWLVPNRLEVTDVVRWMCSNADGENQFWWAVQLHRHYTWPEQLCSALRFWLLEDPFPFSVQPWAISEPLSIQNTPPLEPGDKLQLCAQALAERPDFDWVILGLKRIWNHHRASATDKDIFLLGSILLPLGEIDLLREGDELPESFVRRQLPFVLLRHTTTELRSVLASSTAKRSFIVPAIYEELLRRGYSDSVQFFEYQYQKNRDVYWLISLAKYVPERVHPLLMGMSFSRDQTQHLLDVLLPILPVAAALKLQRFFVLDRAEETGS